MPGNFLDTNVFIYLASKEPEKALRVEDLLQNECAISVQVLNEIANVARRKMRLSWQETLDFLGLIRSLTTVEPVSLDTLDEGLRIASRYQLSVYDGKIVASALLADCGTLWSEDMQDGLMIDNRLTIRNPFSTASH
jgi:predicted nucleic acid-binding protein